MAATNTRHLDRSNALMQGLVAMARSVPRRTPNRRRREWLWLLQSPLQQLYR
jgi:hypothetical protein